MKKGLFFGLIMLLCLAFVQPVTAAPQTGWRTTEEGMRYYQKGRPAKGFVVIKKKTYFFENGKMVKNDWILRKGKYYYAGKKGIIIKNKLAKVDGASYYFNERGIMQKGWQQLKKGWYYFGPNGKMWTGIHIIKKKVYLLNDNGVMQTGVQTRGKITYIIADDGHIEAKIVQKKKKTFYYGPKGKELSEDTARHYKTLMKARQIVAENTTPDMTKEEKLYTCFRWVMKKGYITQHVFSEVCKLPNWPAIYANDHFDTGYGNCFSDAAAFAYLAKAIGYKDTYVCVDADGTNPNGHSWAEVGGLVYDPLFAEAKGFNRYYGVPYSVFELHPILHVEV